MEQGWVYVLVNSSIPGMAKVGRTTRPPAERAAELSAVTGVATPFILAFDQAFADCVDAERRIHAELDRRALRVAPNREFFRGSPSDIVRVVLEASETCQPVSPPSAHPSAEMLRRAGDCHLQGLGPNLQDTGEALRCYRLAAARGSLLAQESMGRIFAQLYLDRRDTAGRRRALAALKEGVRMGNYYCYEELARIFAAERHLANTLKSWDLFFAAHQARGPLPVLPDAAERFPAACARYIACCLELGLPPGHRPALQAAAAAIQSALLQDIGQLPAAGSTRWRATEALRWAYETLGPPSPASRPAAPRRRRPWLQMREPVIA